MSKTSRTVEACGRSTQISQKSDIQYLACPVSDIQEAWGIYILSVPGNLFKESNSISKRVLERAKPVLPVRYGSDFRSFPSQDFEYPFEFILDVIDAKSDRPVAGGGLTLRCLQPAIGIIDKSPFGKSGRAIETFMRKKIWLASQQRGVPVHVLFVIAYPNLKSYPFAFQWIIPALPPILHVNLVYLRTARANRGNVFKKITANRYP